MTTLEKVKALDDFKALRLFRHIEMEMVQKAKADLPDIIDNLPDAVKNMPEMRQLDQVSEEKFVEPLQQEFAVKIARQSLELMAKNPDTVDYLKDKLENWNDNEMVAGTILALGGALSAVMIMSTFRVSYNKADGWEFNLGASKDNQSETIKTIFEALFKVLKPG
jgi:hypothetical protein